MTEARKPSKAVMNALEKVWSAEIDAALAGRPFWCFQSKAKIYMRLAEEGLVEWTIVVLCGEMPVRIEGWELTHAGRWLYCENCEEPEG